MPDYSRRFPGQPYQGDQYVPAAPATGGGSGTGGALTDGDYGDIVVSGTGTVFSIDPAVITSFARSFLDDADATAVKTTLGLQNVNNTADSGKNVLSATKLTTARTINGQPFDGSANITINAVDATARIASSEKGAANGVAPLDASSKIAAAYLPAYVDDVLEYVNLAGFPTTGSAGIIYIADDTGKTYRWSGSAYVEISPSPGSTDSVTEGATNLYYTDARVRAALLTGLASGSGSIAATDSILVAFGKAKAKLDGLAAVASSGSAADLGTGTLPAARMPALTGDVTTTAGAVASTIANNAVSYAKMQDTAAASVLLGRGSAGGAGDPQEITLGSGLAMVGTVLSATGG
ncbi:hypothetical protein, partial [Sphingomonas sp.]|uniref:hypothetical protein n=1 Tax=Sphingomonas sp. TaxID=28214 RepID=UPI0025D54AD5